jgi:hypothetical protein
MSDERRSEPAAGPRAREAPPGAGPPAGAAEGRERADSDRGVRAAAPGLARMTAEAWWNTAGWALGTAVRAGEGIVRTALSLGEAAPVEVPRPSGSDYSDREEARASLRDRGAELLRKSADVHFDEESHPAYENILEDLAPDEARILRLLAAKGPQAAVDVRAGLPLASQLVAPGLSMIGAEAGCRYPDRVHRYLNNLNRLGLVWFSRETLEDPLRYQVLEAQPEVIEARREAGRLGRTVRRTIHLTPFGADFCQAALPTDTLEFDAVVETHSTRRPRADGEPTAGEAADDDTILPDPVPPNPEPLGPDRASSRDG